MPNLRMDAEYEKADIEEIFGIRFGYRINGIVVRKQEKHSESRLILLFHRNGGPYPDLISDKKIRYIGAGLSGDQSLVGVNRVLAERGPVDGVHFFDQSRGSFKWKYLGHGVARFAGEEHTSGRKLLIFDVYLGEG